MGLKSFFNSLIQSTDNQTPNSLGNNASKKSEDVNLGANIQEEPSEEAKENPSENPVTPEDKQDTAEGQGKKEKKEKRNTYNLIILDESGSMGCVRYQTIMGCNETLNGIRETAKTQPDTKQYVSIFCFDTSNSRYLIKNTPIEETKDLTPEDYMPNSSTPLYDAIGHTVTQLKSLIDETDSAAVVTIITDGYENASQRWSHHAVVELIESLKKKGWVFTFMGANIDVERTSLGLGINSFRKFEQTDEGMQEMFEADKRSRRAWNAKMDYMYAMKQAKGISEVDELQAIQAMNKGFFVDKERIAPSFIQTLNEDEVFVFGSNIRGHHSGGAALYALTHFGAVEGQAEGIQGQSYAIPTYGNTFEDLRMAIKRFTEYAVMHPDNKFMLTAIGCGVAGYGVEQIAPLFRHAYAFGNVYVPKSFLPYILL